MAEIVSLRERAGARERLIRQSKVNGIIAREELRSMVYGVGLLGDILDIAAVLQRGVEPITVEDGGLVEIPLEGDRIKSLRAAADIKLALLRKKLPDLKSVELTGLDGSSLFPQQEVHPIELLNRLRAFSNRATGDGLQGDDSRGAADVHREPERAGTTDVTDTLDARGSESMDTPGGWSPETGFL